MEHIKNFKQLSENINENINKNINENINDDNYIITVSDGFTMDKRLFMVDNNINKNDVDNIISNIYDKNINKPHSWFLKELKKVGIIDINLEARITDINVNVGIYK